MCVSFLLTCMKRWSQRNNILQLILVAIVIVSHTAAQYYSTNFHYDRSIVEYITNTIAISVIVLCTIFPQKKFKYIIIYINFRYIHMLLLQEWCAVNLTYKEITSNNTILDYIERQKYTNTHSYIDYFLAGMVWTYVCMHVCTLYRASRFYGHKSTPSHSKLNIVRVFVQLSMLSWQFNSWSCRQDDKAWYSTWDMENNIKVTNIIFKHSKSLIIIVLTLKVNTSTASFFISLCLALINLQ